MKGCENSMPMLVPEIVTEAYYGKPKELVAVEKDLNKIIEWIKDEYSVSRISKKTIVEINGTKECANLENAFKKAFNLGNIDITFYGGKIGLRPAKTKYGKIILPTIELPNAYTLPQILIKLIKKTKNEKFTSKDIDAKIFVDKALIFYYKLTPGEIISVILHELGHCFDTSMFNMMTYTLPSITDLLNIDEFKTWIASLPIAMILRSIIRSGMGPILQELEKIKNNSVFNRINMVLSSIMSIDRLYRDIRNVMTFLSLNKYRFNYEFMFMDGLKKALEPRTIFGYAGEKFADSFATAYGYGPEISSFLRKLDLGRGNEGLDIKNMHVVNVMYDFMKVAISIPYAFSDEHPDSAIRVYSQLKKLRRELNDPNLPKELKKELESQITELEKTCESMMSFRDNAKRGMFLSAVLTRLTMKVFKGYTDPREVLELIWRHEA